MEALPYYLAWLDVVNAYCIHLVTSFQNNN